MRLTSEADINQLENGYLSSAALNTALELGLFWNLDQQPQTATQVAVALQIPFERCRAWLELLRDLGLLEKESDAYAVSSLTRTAILDANSRATESFLAWQRRVFYGAGLDLAKHIKYPGSVWEAQGERTPDDYQLIKDDPVWAEQFTRMLYEIHQPLAEELTDLVEITGARRMMDLGGGSGVMSFGFLRRHPQLTSVVVDLENVCRVGREIAAANSLEDRVTYLSMDLVCDDLPSGFDLVLQCGLAIYNPEHLGRIRNALNSQGRLLIIQRFAEPDASSTFPATEIFRRTLVNPNYCLWTLAEMKEMLADAGFQFICVRTLSTGELLVETRRS